jgi:hypothetical protein
VTRPPLQAAGTSPRPATRGEFYADFVVNWRNSMKADRTDEFEARLQVPLDRGLQLEAGDSVQVCELTLHLRAIEMSGQGGGGRGVRKAVAGDEQGFGSSRGGRDEEPHDDAFQVRSE